MDTKTAANSRKVLSITVANYTSLQLRPEFTEIVSDMDNLPQMTVGEGEGTYNDIGCH